MNKTVLILKHEFSHLVKRKGFVIMTLVFPLIGLSAIGIFQLAQRASVTSDPADIPRIGYVAELGGFEDDTSQPDDISLLPYNTREEATDALLAEDIDEYFIIPTDYIQSGGILRYTLKKELEISDETRQAIKVFLQDNLLEGQTSPEIAERVKYPMWLDSIRLDETGQVATDQGGFGAFIVPAAFGILLIMSIFASSGYLLQGLGEEKENRIMELLLSSVSTRQLLIGKVLGLGAAGLVQIVIWLLSAVFLVRLASNIIGGELTTIQIPDNLLFLGIIYFILGYLLFAVLQAGIGAIGATARESQQMTVVLILPAMVPFYVFILFLQDNPDHVLGTILTLIPLTAPMSVFIRLGTSEIPAWELVLSIGLLVAGIIGGLVLAAKAFRVFLLMYGKTPRLGEILRLLKQA